MSTPAFAVSQIRFGLPSEQELVGPFGEAVCCRSGLYSGVLQIRATRTSIWFGLEDREFVEVFFDFLDDSRRPTRLWAVLAPEDLMYGGEDSMSLASLRSDAPSISLDSAITDRRRCRIRLQGCERVYEGEAPAWARFGISLGEDAMEINILWEGPDVSCTKFSPNFAAVRKIPYGSLLSSLLRPRELTPFRSYVGPEECLSLWRFYDAPPTVDELRSSPIRIASEHPVYDRPKRQGRWHAVSFSTSETRVQHGPIGTTIRIGEGRYEGIAQVHGTSDIEPGAFDLTFDFFDATHRPCRSRCVASLGRLQGGSVCAPSDVPIADPSSGTLHGPLPVPADLSCSVEELTGRLFWERQNLALYDIWFRGAYLFVRIVDLSRIGDDDVPVAYRRIDLSTLLLQPIAKRSDSQVRMYPGPETFLDIVQLTSVPQPLLGSAPAPVRLEIPDDTNGRPVA